jgi:hypothetical protein
MARCCVVLRGGDNESRTNPRLFRSSHRVEIDPDDIAAFRA